MAFALVQGPVGANDTVGTATTVTITISTGAGNLVVVHVRVTGTGNTCTGVSDSAGNAYALIGPVDNTNRLYLAYGVQVTGATTVTASFTGANATKQLIASEYSGGAATNAAIFDASGTGTGTSTTPAVSTITTAASGELIVSVAHAPTAPSSWAAGSGFTIIGAGARDRVEYKPSGGASETCPWTLGSSVAWAAIGAAFKPASAATPNAGFFRFM